MYDKVKRTEEEVVMANFVYYSGIHVKWLKKATKKKSG
jgi:hypothetical protein